MCIYCGLPSNQGFACCFVVEDRNGHAPRTLPRDTPVRPLPHRSHETLLQPTLRHGDIFNTVLSKQPHIRHKVHKNNEWYVDVTKRWSLVRRGGRLTRFADTKPCMLKDWRDSPQPVVWSARCWRTTACWRAEYTVSWCASRTGNCACSSRYE